MNLSLPDFSFFQVTAGSFFGLGIRYAFLAGLAWVVCYFICRQRWFHRKIIARFPAASEVRREIAYSTLSIVIFAISGGITVELARHGYTQLYWRISDYGTAWFWASVVLTIILHDTWFYWTHRAMHHKRLFPYFHRVHHLSHNPSPWASYAFDPLEACVHAAVFPLAAFLLPIHPLAFALFMGWQILFNVVGHTGYEIYPRWLLDSWIGRILNTPTNHIMHHEKLRGNYGIYFNVWDRLMGTNHADYEKRFREVASRRRQPADHAEHAPVSPSSPTS